MRIVPDEETQEKPSSEDIYKSICSLPIIIDRKASKTNLHFGPDVEEIKKPSKMWGRRKERI